LARLLEAAGMTVTPGGGHLRGGPSGCHERSPAHHPSESRPARRDVCVCRGPGVTLRHRPHNCSFGAKSRRRLRQARRARAMGLVLKSDPPEVLIPMNVVRRGFRVLFEADAVAYDRAATSAREEFTRKVRTIAGNFQLFARERWLFNPRRNRLWFKPCRTSSRAWHASAPRHRILRQRGTRRGRLAGNAPGAAGRVLRLRVERLLSAQRADTHSPPLCSVRDLPSQLGNDCGLRTVHERAARGDVGARVSLIRIEERVNEPVRDVW
jgi:hypothetical protein